MSQENATPATAHNAIRSLLLVSLLMERILMDLLPLLPKAKRDSLGTEMNEIRATLNDLVVNTPYGKDP